MNECSMSECSMNEFSMNGCSNSIYLNYTVCKLYSSSFLFYSQKRAGILDHSYSRPPLSPLPSRNHTTSLEDKFLFQLSIIACSQIVMLCGLNSTIHYMYLCSLCTRDSVKLLNNKS